MHAFSVNKSMNGIYHNIDVASESRITSRITIVKALVVYRFC